MGTIQEDLRSGRDLLEGWLAERFPDADVIYLGLRDGSVYRWTVDFGPGKSALRLSATERALESAQILQERLEDLERGTWLHDVETQDKWIELTSIAVAQKRRDDW